MAKLRGWGPSSTPHGGEQVDSDSDGDGPQTPEYAYSGAFDKRPGPSVSPSKHHTASSSALAAASSLLHKVPGAKRLSLLNATLLGLLGLAAVLAAWGGGWYLPAQQMQLSLPLHFDYAAGPSAAGAWLPLLRATPLTAALTPPPHQRPLPAAAALSFQGSLGPGGSISVSSAGGPEGSGFGSQLGFLGLGFGPASAAAAGSPQRRSGGWLFGRGSGSARASGSSNGAQGAGAAGMGTAGAVFRGGVDVGSGVVVPEGDWLVPLWGRMELAVELELPPWPEPDLVQLTSELVSQQGIVLGRTTRTWVPKPRPLLFRVADFVIFGLWRALGLKDDTIRVQLPMFDGFQNPQPPPGGWGSVAGLNPAKARAGECLVQDVPGQSGAAGSSSSSSSKGSRAAGTEDDGVAAWEGLVSGPRAMWLRVTMVGRSAGYGPPKVYRAAAHLRTKLSLLDRLAGALRPSMLTCLLLLAAGLGLAVGGTGAAAVLLLLAYALYRWGSASSAAAAAGQYGGGCAAAAAAAAPAGAAVHAVGPGQREEGEEEEEEFGERFYEPGFEAGFEGSSLSGVGGGWLGEAQESGMHAADKALRAESPASFDNNAGEHHQQQYFETGEFLETYDSDAYASSSWQQQQHGEVEVLPQHRGAGNSSSSSAAALRPEGQHGGSGSSTVSAIRRMLGWQQQPQQQGAAANDADTAAAEESLMHDTGVSGLPADAEDEWREQLLADSEDEQQQQHCATAAAGKGSSSSSSGAAVRQEEEHSSQTAAAGASRRAGFTYQM